MMMEMIWGVNAWGRGVEIEVEVEVVEEEEDYWGVDVCSRTGRNGRPG